MRLGFCERAEPAADFALLEADLLLSVLDADFAAGARVTLSFPFCESAEPATDFDALEPLFERRALLAADAAGLDVLLLGIMPSPLLGQ